jgi:predicted nucleic acid-binding protein
LKIVDSVGWIAYLSDAPLADEYAEYIASPSDLVTPTVVLHEVYKHSVRNFGEETARFALAAIVKTEVIPLTSGLAVWAAQVGIRHKLSLADSVIYATALATGATVVTSDAHFEGLPQVEYIARNAAS